MNVLVIGGAGYIGCMVCHALLRAGHTVRVFDRLYFGEDGLRDIQPRISIIQGDMRTMPDSVLVDQEAVICLGGLSNDPSANSWPEANHEMNTVAVEAVAKQAREHGVHRFVFASTCSIYDTMTSDADDVVQDETAEVCPRSAYAKSKYEAEQRLWRLANSNFEVIVLRKGTVFGWSPRMRWDLVVNTFVKDALLHGCINLHNGGEMWRPLLGIEDAAHAYVLTVECAMPFPSQLFNLARQNYRISELALSVREILRARDYGDPQIVPTYENVPAVRNYRVSSEKFIKAFDFTFIQDIEGAVADMAANTDVVELVDPVHYNIHWMKVLEQAERIVAGGNVF